MIKKSEKWSYLLGMFGQNIIFFTVSTGFAYYLQNVLFIPAIAVSVILTLGQVLDAINDPIFGLIIDRTNTKWGKCRPYILFGTPIIALITILVFTNNIYYTSNSAKTNTLIILWAGVVYIIWGFVYSICDVPMVTLPSLLTDNEKERTKIQSLSKIFGSVGSGVMLFLLPLAQLIGTKLSEKTGNNDKGLQYGVFIVVAALTLCGTIFLQLTGIFSKEHIVVKQTAEHKGIISSFKQMWQCKPYRQILLSQIIKSPISTTDRINAVYLSYYYGNNGATSYVYFSLLFGLSGLAGQFIANAILPKLTEKIPKISLYKFGCVLSSAAFTLYFLLYLIAPSSLNRPGFAVIIIFLLIINGFGCGIQNVLCYVFIASAIDYEEYHTGHRPDGVFFSGQLLMNKVSNGVGAAIVGIATALFGFSGANVQAVNNALYNGADFKSDPAFAKYRLMMMALCTIPYAVFMFLSVIPMRKYALSDDEYEEIQNGLKERH